MVIKKHFRTAVLTATILVGVSGCGKRSEPVPLSQKDVRCETGTVQLTEVPVLLTATGSLEAEKTVMVSTRMMGWVTRIHVSEGQAVAKGAPLVSIDDTDLLAKKAQAEAGISEAEAVLANAQRMAERFERLYADKSVSKSQLDDVLTGRDRAAAGVEMARAGLREVEVHLSYLDIVAPTSGVVARRMIEEGDMANPGMPLVVLEQTGSVKVVAHLAERDVAQVQPGDLVSVDVTSLPGAVHEVPLLRIISSANPGSRTYDIEALIENEDGRLRSGMFARVSVPVGTRPAVLVPAAAIVRRGQLTGVWIVDDESLAHLRWVRLGHESGDSYEILSGLDGGETVVLYSARPLAEGNKVVE